MGVQGRNSVVANPMQRVKVYRLNDEGKWDDRGTGHVTVEYLKQNLSQLDNPVNKNRATITTYISVEIRRSIQLLHGEILKLRLSWHLVFKRLWAAALYGIKYVVCKGPFIFPVLVVWKLDHAHQMMTWNILEHLREMVATMYMLLCMIYRVGYIKDVILPRVLDEPTFATLNSIIQSNNAAVVSSLKDDGSFIHELFARLKSSEASDQTKKNLVLFLQEFCSLSKSLQLVHQMRLFRDLVNEGLFEIITNALQSQEKLLRLNGTDILIVVLNQDPTLLRTFVMQPEGNALLGLLVKGMSTDFGEDLHSQYLEIIRMLLDPYTIAGPQRDSIIELFYDKYMDQLVDVITRSCPAKENTEMSRKSTSNDDGTGSLGPVGPDILSNICELLCFCVLQHPYRINDDEEDSASARINHTSNQSAHPVMVNGNASTYSSFRGGSIGLVDYEDEDDSPEPGSSTKVSEVVKSNSMVSSFEMNDPLGHDVVDFANAKRKLDAIECNDGESESLKKRRLHTHTKAFSASADSIDRIEQFVSKEKHASSTFNHERDVESHRVEVDTGLERSAAGEESTIQRVSSNGCENSIAEARNGGENHGSSSVSTEGSGSVRAESAVKGNNSLKGNSCEGKVSSAPSELVRAGPPSPEPYTVR